MSVSPDLDTDTDTDREIARLRARIRQLEAAAAARESQVDTSPTLDRRLEDFAAANNGWFWETDAELRFTYFSQSVFDITGVEPAWHYGKTRAEIGIPVSITQEQWRAHMDVLARREPFTNFDFQRQGPDGEKWLRTSGVPVFDDAGDFTGYRGTATDITAEVLADSRNRELTAAIEYLDDLFVLWDADDKLVVCNQRFRELNAAIIETTAPGTDFQDHIRAAISAGLYPGCAADPEGWFRERMKSHREPGAAFEQKRQDGRWLLISEQKLPNGATATIATDITRHMQAEAALQAQHAILSTALSTIPDGVQILDANLDLVAWNDRLFEVLDLDGEAILSAANPGKAFRHALAERGEYGAGDIDDLVASREAIARSRAPVQYERQLTTGKWMECRGNPLDSGGYLAIYRDIDDAKRSVERLESLASTDPLTGLPNRRSFLEAAEAEFQRSRRYGRPLSFLILDIDHFKSVNDRFGHAVGDEALRQIAKCCRETLRGSDRIGRIGGEEFAVMLPETGPDLCFRAAERLRRALAETSIPTDGDVLWLTASIGGAQMSAAHAAAEQVLATADTALYDAKNGGRNRVIVHK